MRIVALTQARMGSSRLPGKVLADVVGDPLLARVIERARRARRLGAVVVVTTEEPADDAIVSLCRERGYGVHRGSALDVLDRYYRGACRLGADVVVRLAADCPLIDPGLIDETVDMFLDSARPVDYASNRICGEAEITRIYPIGLDVEVFSFAALERAWHEARADYHREHVTPYLYESPGRFRVLGPSRAPDHAHLRWTVDTDQDLRLVRTVYARFEGRDDFTWRDVVDLFGREPELAAINAGVTQKSFRESQRRP